ncbi:MAG: beta-ketoacyl-[acyl-carrier-protein] synthase family protein [Byssovorax sp.]
MSRAATAVITGMGAVASIGVGLDAFWRGIAAGKTGIGASLRFSTEAYAVRLGASLDPTALPPGLLDSAPDPDHDHAIDPCAAIAILAAREAVERSGITAAALRPDRLAIVMGTSAGGLHARSAYEFTDPRDRGRRHRLLDRSGFHVQTAAVADALGLDGPRLTISTACASSTHALAHARDLLRADLADAVIVGGVDLLIEETFAGFHAMGAISAAPCAPFSLPVGMSVGEGAGFVVLERLDDTARRGREPLAAVLGAGSSSDGHHPTAPDPTGLGIARALRSALDDAGVTPAEIGYFNAHGTGTEANDLAEWRALQRVFGVGVDALPVSSTKSYLGHTLGAAGILEIIATVLAMRRGLLPPTLGFTASRGHGPIDLIAAVAPRPAVARYALKSSSAFGGANAAVVLAVDAREIPAITASIRASDVVILGASAIAAHGFEGLDAALRRGAPLWKSIAATDALVPLPPVAARVPELPLARLVRGVDPRGMDTITRFLTAAAALALADAGLVVRGPLRDRVGLYAGAGRLPWDSADAFWDSIRARGFGRLSAPAFSRIVMNAAAGAAARTLSLLGPTSLFAGGPLGGLQAILAAADRLAHHADADALVAGAADELGRGMLADHAFSHPDAGREGLPFPLYGADHQAPVRGEGAACVVLARAGSPLGGAKRPVARVAGSGLSGPRGLATAIRIALQSAEISPGDVDAIHGSADGLVASGRAEIDALRAVFGDALRAIPLANPASVLGACDSLSALTTVAAIEVLRSGRAHPIVGATPHPDLDFTASTPRPVRTVLIIAADPAAGSAALVLTAP